MNIANITHPNKIIDKKVKHFYDHFHYLLSPNRDMVSFPLENHLTILEKIDFKLENYIIAPSSIKVAIAYLSHHPLLNTSSDFFARKKVIKDLLTPLKGLQKKTDINQLFNNNLQNLITVLNGKEKLDGHLYFQKTLNELIGLLSTELPIEKNKKKINYFTELLAAEFLRVGFEKKDFTNGKGILGQILSKEIHLDEEDKNEIYTEFPLPSEIERFRGTDEFKEKVEAFLKNMNFVKQFEGLYNAFSKTNHARFIFRIRNISDYHQEFNFETKGVKVYHRSLLKIDNSNWRKSFNTNIEEMINEKNTCLIEVQLKYKSETTAEQIAMRATQKAIDFLNYAGNFPKTKEKAYLDTSNYLILHANGGAKIRWNNNDLHISPSKLERSIDHLYPSPFNSLSEVVKNKIKQNDNILFRASSTDFWDEQISYYWRYFEGLFSKDNWENNSKADKIIQYISYSLLLKEIEIRRHRLEHTIVNILMSMSANDTGISKQEMAHKVTLYMKKKIEFSEFRKYSKYPFLVGKFEKYDTVESSINYKKTFQFYKTLLWETYEQRNIIFHQNIFCPSTLKKLVEYLPIIIWRFRVLLIDKLTDVEGIEINEALGLLKKEGQSLVK